MIEGYHKIQSEWKEIFGETKNEMVRGTHGLLT